MVLLNNNKENTGEDLSLGGFLACGVHLACKINELKFEHHKYNTGHLGDLY